MVEEYQQAISMANLRDAPGLYTQLGLNNSPQVRNTHHWNFSSVRVYEKTLHCQTEFVSSLLHWNACSQQCFAVWLLE